MMRFDTVYRLAKLTLSPNLWAAILWGPSSLNGNHSFGPIYGDSLSFLVVVP